MILRISFATSISPGTCQYFMPTVDTSLDMQVASRMLLVEDRKWHVVRQLHNKLQATKAQFLQDSQLMHEALSAASSQMRSGNSQSMSNKYADSLRYAPNLPEGRTCIMHLLHCWAVVLFALSVCSVLSVQAVQCLTTGKLHDLGCELNLSRRQQVHHQSISSPRSMLVLTIDSRRGTEI